MNGEIVLFVIMLFMCFNAFKHFIIIIFNYLTNEDLITIVIDFLNVMVYSIVTIDLALRLFSNSHTGIW